MEHDVLAQKKELSAQELSILSSEAEKRKKSKGVMWLLWLFTGTFGGHRYYLGDTGRAITHTIVFVIALFRGVSATVSAITIDEFVQAQTTMYLLLGIPALWGIIDAFFIGRRLVQKNTEIEAEVIGRIKNMRNTEP